MVGEFQPLLNSANSIKYKRKIVRKAYDKIVCHKTHSENY